MTKDFESRPEIKTPNYRLGRALPKP